MRPQALALRGPGRYTTRFQAIKAAVVRRDLVLEATKRSDRLMAAVHTLDETDNQHGAPAVWCDR